MAFRKGAELALNLFRTRASVSRLVAGTPRLGPLILVDNASRVPIFSSPVHHRLGVYNSNRFSGCGAKRFYHVERPRGPNRWFQNERTGRIVVLVSCGAVISVCFGSWETVPYTKRVHFVLLPRAMERKLGEFLFKREKARFKRKILPPTQPDSDRVSLISQEIIQALQRGQNHEQAWREVDDAVAALTSDKGPVSRVQESRKKGSTSHLEGLNWEVVVVDDATINACCMPGGKIVVFTGLLKRFWSNEEIANDYRVGHAVARHVAENIAKGMWLVIVQLIGGEFMGPDLVNKMSTLLLMSFSRKMELEADRIGLMLMASAGYDPRRAPKVYEKLGKLGGDREDDSASTHPSGKKRAQQLAQADVMGEAVTIYREARRARDTEGLLQSRI